MAIVVMMKRNRIVSPYIEITLGVKCSTRLVPSPRKGNFAALRRTSCQNLRRSRPQEVLDVLQRIRLRFLGACGLASPGSWFASRTVHSEIAWLIRESGMQSQKAGNASDFTGRGEGFVDFPEEAPLDFCDLLCAHAEHASPLGQLFKVGFDVELGDVRREALKRQHILIS